jgi:hypothetical protein
VTVCLRPEQIGLRPPGRPPRLAEEPFNRFPVRLAGEIARGSRYTLFVNLVSPVGPDFPVADAPPDLELEITAQQYAEIQQAAHPLWEVEINPAVIHLIF